MAFVYIAANVKNGKGSPAIVKKAFGTAAKVTRPLGASLRLIVQGLSRTRVYILFLSSTNHGGLKLDQKLKSAFDEGLARQQ